uniref:Uncharacterized protein n=1 Tax=Timema bartmani TaxID=61472 RepID=A0A7R9HWU8_9NEOP|nr:unnamed protein product [Timema bartmani]
MAIEVHSPISQQSLSNNRPLGAAISAIGYESGGPGFEYSLVPWIFFPERELPKGIRGCEIGAWLFPSHSSDPPSSPGAVREEVGGWGGRGLPQVDHVPPASSRSHRAVGGCLNEVDCRLQDVLLRTEPLTAIFRSAKTRQWRPLHSMVCCGGSRGQTKQPRGELIICSERVRAGNLRCDNSAAVLSFITAHLDNSGTTPSLHLTLNKNLHSKDMQHLIHFHQSHRPRNNKYGGVEWDTIPFCPIPFRPTVKY